jgi:alpha-beta hydrolase superfamily lysophospholipase
MRGIGIAALVLIAASTIASAIVGREAGPEVLHPERALLDAQRLGWVNDMLARTHATREDFEVRAPDGAILRGWKIRAAAANGDWVLLFHGVGDNRAGMSVFAEFLLRAGYSVMMMDSRAQGESGGEVATYGWKERWDTVAIVNALESSESVRHLFALGISMGAAIALQSAAVEPRIEAVVAEDPFANLREVSYDYAGLQRWPWLGKTLFRPASMEGMRALHDAGGFEPDQVSPQRAVAERAFPVLLICGTADHTIPCRHAEMIYRAARGPKELWIVKGAKHASAYGVAPAEYEQRVLTFFRRWSGDSR